MSKGRRRMTNEEIDIVKYWVCCPMCDNKKCVKGTDKCEAETWAREKRRRQIMTDEKVIDLLDRIKAEIADIYCGQYCETPLTADAVKEMTLEIIDKYKAENENE